jgi:hypothetical protein
MKFVIQPISAEAFAPHGTLVRAPADVGRTPFPSALSNLRADAIIAQGILAFEILLSRGKVLELGPALEPLRRGRCLGLWRLRYNTGIPC